MQFVWIIIDQKGNLWQERTMGESLRDFFVSTASGTLRQMILVVLFIPDLFVHDWEGESAPYEWKAEIIVVADVY